jgi:hypothetical protein
VAPKLAQRARSCLRSRLCVRGVGPSSVDLGTRFGGGPGAPDRRIPGVFNRSLQADARTSSTTARSGAARRLSSGLDDGAGASLPRKQALHGVDPGPSLLVRSGRHPALLRDACFPHGQHADVGCLSRRGRSAPGRGLGRSCADFDLDPVAQGAGALLRPASVTRSARRAVGAPRLDGDEERDRGHHGAEGLDGRLEAERADGDAGEDRGDRQRPVGDQVEAVVTAAQ